jgi:hypothetical protein
MVESFVLRAPTLTLLLVGTMVEVRPRGGLLRVRFSLPRPGEGLLPLPRVAVVVVVIRDVAVEGGGVDEHRE